MTATIYAFPTACERDDLEFGRTGSSPYIRITDEALSIWAAVNRPRVRVALAERIEALQEAINRLAGYRPEAIDDELLLSDCHVRIRDAPAMLLGRLGRA